jgi:hypothetical protein
MSQAIKSDYFTDFRKIVEKEEEQPVKEEQQIYWMSKQPGWKHIETYIKDLIIALDVPAQQSMENGCSYDEIGRKTIVAQLTKEFLNKILDKVKNAKESIAPND